MLRGLLLLRHKRLLSVFCFWSFLLICFWIIFQPVHGQTNFVRGDCDGDGQVIGLVTDAIFLLEFNFTGGPTPNCLKACDFNDDGNVISEVADSIYLLQFNFLGGPHPAAPFNECGLDLTPDKLECTKYTACLNKKIPEAWAEIGPEGGTLRLDATGDPGDGTTLVIPKGLFRSIERIGIIRIDLSEKSHVTSVGPLIRLVLPQIEQGGRIGLLIPYQASDPGNGGELAQAKDNAKEINSVGIIVVDEERCCQVLIDVLKEYDEIVAEVGQDLPEDERPLITSTSLPAGFAYTEIAQSGDYTVVKNDIEICKEQLTLFHLAGRDYPTYVIVHGWNDEATWCPNTWQVNMANKILRLLAEDPSIPDVLHDDANILFWDWSAAARTGLLWWLAYSRTSREGEKLALAIGDLMQRGIIDDDPKRIHLIGHSYGGYVSAVCGHVLKTMMGERVGQLTGLDVPGKLLLTRFWDFLGKLKKLLASLIRFSPEHPPEVGIYINSEDFCAVTWYPVVGGIDHTAIIVSPQLLGNNVLNQPVRGDVDHSTIKDWYQKIVINDRIWDSWVAIKLFRRHYLFGSIRTTLQISYELEAQGIDDRKDPRNPLIAATASEGGSEVLTYDWNAAIKSFRKIVASGEESSAISEIRVNDNHPFLLKPSTSWGIDLFVKSNPLEGHARAMANVKAETEGRLEVEGIKTSLWERVPVIVRFAGTVTQALQLEKETRILPATTGIDPQFPEFPVENYSIASIQCCQTTFNIASNAYQEVKVNGMEYKHDFQEAYVEFSEWHAYIEPDCELSSMEVFNPFGFSAYLSKKGCEHVLSSFEVLPEEPALATEFAESFWGHPLEFVIDYEDGSGLRFITESPGLYVLGYTLISLRDETRATEKVVLFVWGDAEPVDVERGALE